MRGPRGQDFLDWDPMRNELIMTVMGTSSVLITLYLQHVCVYRICLVGPENNPFVLGKDYLGAGESAPVYMRTEVGPASTSFVRRRFPSITPFGMT